MQRRIIRIDAARCDGCGKCITGCPEGALQVIDGKARVVSESTCDGLGACIEECPKGAISIEVREAAAYSEAETLQRILPQGAATLKAHLRHLYDHMQTDHLEEALSMLRAAQVPIPDYRPSPSVERACPGAGHRTLEVGPIQAHDDRQGEHQQALRSQLAQWPIQLHLIQPRHPSFTGQSVLLVADCVAFALPDFNQKYLPGKRLLVACPKLDPNQEIYVTKLATLMDEGRIASLHVLIMEVPCCGGLLRLAEGARHQASRKVPIHCTVVGLDGEVRRQLEA